MIIDHRRYEPHQLVFEHDGDPLWPVATIDVFTDGNSTTRYQARLWTAPGADIGDLSYHSSEDDARSWLKRELRATSLVSLTPAQLSAHALAS